MMDPVTLLNWLYAGGLIADAATKIVDQFINAGIDPTDDEMAAALAENESDTDALHEAGQHDQPNED